MHDPIELARRAGYLDHFAGLSDADGPPYRDPAMRAAWLEGWSRRRDDVARRTDAVRRSTEGHGTVTPEMLGATPAALPA